MDKDFDKDILATQLKGLCKHVMGTDDSNCCDGACDNCPITGVLEMLENQ